MSGRNSICAFTAVFAALWSTVPVASSAVASPTYTVFDAHGGGTMPAAIDDSNAITGSYENGAGVERGFLRMPDGKIVSFSPQHRARGHQEPGDRAEGRSLW
ncbi:MAG TPA: hypothetical protein VHU23_15530 [Rhizomicrobium sp.]|jgi:hypothetical protein|nr:hypothetical protein [Rhizomicrobium sp.]